jgi:hypothetical protein
LLASVAIAMLRRRATLAKRAVNKLHRRRDVSREAAMFHAKRLSPPLLD